MIQLVHEKEVHGVLFAEVTGVGAPIDEILEGVVGNFNPDSLSAIYTVMAAIQYLRKNIAASLLWLDIAELHRPTNSLGKYLIALIDSGTDQSKFVATILEAAE